MHKVTFLAMFVGLLLGCCHGYKLSGTDLGITIRQETEAALGGDEIENMMNVQATFKTTVPNGENIVDELATELGVRLNTYNKAVIALRDKIKRIYPDFTQIPVDRECCKVSNTMDHLSYDTIFREEVDKKNLCYRRAANNQRDLYFAPKSLTDTMRANAEDIPNLGWQYFGTEQGVQHIYPLNTIGSCTAYDPRLRPWYAEANAPIAKDIVIVFDFTTNTGANMEAISLILTTTNPNDRLAMVAVGNPEPRTPPEGCYASQLAQASKRNKAIFLKFANGTKNNKISSDYKRAFQRAFDYFENGQDGRSGRRKLLIFMTDSDSRGSSTEESIMKSVRKENEEKANNTVVIQTYSFGSDINAETKELLTNLANQTEFVTSSGVHKRGRYIHVESQKDLRVQLTSYYDTFSESGLVQRPVITAPYEDFSGLGTVISLCLPVHDDADTLKGVTCIDAKILDIFYNVTYFPERKFAYAFLIDDKGMTIIHPRMPPPSEKSSVFLHISTLEKEATAAGVIASMLNGERSSKSLYVTVKLSGGSHYGEHRDSQIMTATYYWQRVPNSNYSICMVVTDRDSDIEVNLKSDNKLLNTRYLHHQILEELKGEELERQVKTTCKHLGTEATTEGTTVTFDGNARQKLKSSSRPRDDVKSYQEYFQGKRQDIDIFRDGTKEWVYLGGFVDDLWIDRNKRYGGMMYWRHLAMCSGVSRVYPGTRMSDKYTHSLMPWYKSALENPDRVIVTKSNSEEQMNARVFISQTLSVGSPQKRPAGVIAGEFRPGFIYNLLLQTYPECSEELNRCFILDGKGNILAHKHMESDENVHILHMEPAIARDLIKNGHLKQTTCLDFETITFRAQKSWGISLENFITAGHSYEIHTVFGTNVFLGIAWDERDWLPFNIGKTVACDLRNHYPVCHDDLRFDHCNNTFPKEDQRRPSVTCNSATIVPMVANRWSLNSTETCFPFDCSNHLTKNMCLQYIGCQWCYALDGSSSDKVCLQGSQCAKSDPSSKDLLSKILPAVLIVLLISILIIIIVVCYRRGRCRRCLRCHCPLWRKPMKKEVLHFKKEPVDEEDGVGAPCVQATVNVQASPNTRALPNDYRRQRPGRSARNETINEAYEPDHNPPSPSPAVIQVSPPLTPEARPPQPVPRTSTIEHPLAIRPPAPDPRPEERQTSRLQAAAPPHTVPGAVSPYGSYPRHVKRGEPKPAPAPPIPKANPLQSNTDASNVAETRKMSDISGDRYINREAIRQVLLASATDRGSMDLSYPNSSQSQEKRLGHSSSDEGGATGGADSPKHPSDDGSYSTLDDFLAPPSDEVQGEPAAAAHSLPKKSDSGFQSEQLDRDQTDLKRT